MRIVDAQIHLWGSGLPSNMAHRQVTSFTTEEAVRLMDEDGVDAAVIQPRHPDFTQELPRKLLPTRAKGAQSHSPEKR
jgi:hypothetical protein